MGCPYKITRPTPEILANLAIIGGIVEQELTLGSKVVVIGVDKYPVGNYVRKKEHTGKTGIVIGTQGSLPCNGTDFWETTYLVRFGGVGSVDKHYFYERNLSLDLTLAELYPATDETIRFPEPAIKTPKKSKIKHNRICKRNPRRK